MTKILLAGALASALLLQAVDLTPARWEQFRGPRASGIGSDSAKLPSRFGPSESLLWKTPLPKGHGSPCIWGDRVFVTAFDPAEQSLSVIAIDRTNGAILWRQPVKTAALESVHSVSSPATTTPVTDGESVYVYLGSFGFIAYSLDGKVRWEHPMAPSKIPFGSGASPVLAGDLLLITRDSRPRPSLIALNRKDGSLAWRTNLRPMRLGASAAHSTPLVLGDQVILHRPSRVAGHSLKHGNELWWVRTSSVGTATLTEHNGIVFVAAFNMGAAASSPAKTPFAEVLVKYDKDGDGKLSKAETPQDDLFTLRRDGVPDGVAGAHFTVRTFFRGNDKNKDGGIDETEYDAIFAPRPNRSQRTNHGLMAIRPGGVGDVSDTAVLWNERRGVSEVACPLVYRDKVYMITSGGIVTCVEEKTGKLVYRGRVNAPGAYYSSPVAAGGKVLVASGEGVVTSLEVGPELKVLANNDLGEPVYGTPALVDSKIYIRSIDHLWAFGTK